jgi:hypothetical protein
MRSRTIRSIRHTCIVLFFALAFSSEAAEPKLEAATRAEDEQTIPFSKTKIVVSKETTHVLGPLSTDGAIDFFAAINRDLSKGVTLENNGAIAYWRTVGPAQIPENERRALFAVLGIPALSDQGSYFISMRDFFRQRAKTQQLSDKQKDDGFRELYDSAPVAEKQPWSAEKLPLLAQWLEANDAVLDRFVAESQKPRFYFPLYRSQSAEPWADILQSEMDILSSSRDLEQALLARAMLKLHDGRVDAALKDSIACHRFARHIGQGPFLICILFAISLENYACAADRAIAEHGKVSAEQAKRFRSDIHDLPNMPRNDTILPGERLFAINMICRLARQVSSDRHTTVRSLILRASEGEPDRKSDREATAVASLTSDENIDWNMVLRNVNRHFDDLTTVFNESTFNQRKSQVRDIERSEREAVRSGIVPAKDRASRKVADALISEAAYFREVILSAEERSAVAVRLTELSWALSAYHTANGAYPEGLSRLTPRFSTEIPLDPFIRSDFIYKPTAAGYLLYSVGPNENDDGGRDSESTPPGDDIAVQVPSVRPTVRK